jgi:hypothetical protein
VEARLGIDAGDAGVDVHDQHRAGLAREDVQVIDVQRLFWRASGVSR